MYWIDGGCLKYKSNRDIWGGLKGMLQRGSRRGVQSVDSKSKRLMGSN